MRFDRDIFNDTLDFLRPGGVTDRPPSATVPFPVPTRPAPVAPAPTGATPAPATTPASGFGELKGVAFQPSTAPAAQAKPAAAPAKATPAARDEPTATGPLKPGQRRRMKDGRVVTIVKVHPDGRIEYR
jgi:hypothetical protein